jgi:Chitobiase/beta-hexosaminidase C-terminal domain
MNSAVFKIRLLSAVVICGVSGLLHAQVNITTYHTDTARSGQNTSETILTPANVNSTQFGKLFSLPVDGAVYAQLLYLSAVAIGGGTHNVLYAATEHDSVYAIDADSGTVYAQASLIPAGGSTVNSSSDLNCTDLTPEVGITGTPVIDPIGGTLYLIAKSKVNGNIVQYLHALDVTTLAEKFNGPVSIQATVPGTGAGASGGLLSFNAKQENQRPALLLDNNHVVIGWSSHCDISPWHGWVMSYSASTLAQEAVFNASPNGGSNGIWMSGGGLAADAAGNIYFPTGNGTWNGTSDYGDSIVKLGPPVNNHFPVLDYFTPYNQRTLAGDDTDVSSGGLVLLPTLPSGRQLLAQQGKDGTIYLLDINNLGKYCVNLTPACSNRDPQIAQEIMGASPGVWGSPVYWNGNLYWAGVNDNIKAYSFNADNSGLISTTPTSRSAKIFAFAAPTPVISANGSTNGILWALADSTCSPNTNCLGLYAYDATNLAKVLYISSQAPNNRDAPGNTTKFQTPIIANGKVYLGTQNSVSAYGLLADITASPTLSPAPGSYTSTQTITLSDSTPGAVIYYTTDGTTPTTRSAMYSPSTPLQISSTTTIQALAVASGYSSSAVTVGTYTILSTTPVSVSLSAIDNLVGMVANGSSVINGGMDNRGNAYSATLLGTSLTWAGLTFTLGAVGTSNAVSSSTIALPAGNYSTVTLLATGVNGNQVNQPFLVTYTDGTSTKFTQSLSDWFDPQNYRGESQVSIMPYRLTASGATDNRTFYLYGYSFAINSTKTVKSITLPANRNVVVLAIDVTTDARAPTPTASPTLSPAPGSYTSTQTITLSDSTPGAVIYYTTDGTTPTTRSAMYSPSTPLQISSTTTIQALAVASGYSSSAVTVGTYTILSTTPVSVSLSAIDNLVGMVANGSSVINGGMDNRGNAYSATLLGTSLTWAGLTFTLGAVGTSNAVSSSTIALPAGNYSTVTLLATGVNGNQVNQPFLVTYTDGTSTKFTQSLSDWFDPQNYRGESQVSIMPYRLTASGATDNRTFYLYGYSFAINSTKTVKSITLPANRNVVVLAIDLAP